MPATQKATGEAIPTSIRDVCSAAHSCYQRTTEASVAAIGDDIRNWPDMDPINLQGSQCSGTGAPGTDGVDGATGATGATGAFTWDERWIELTPSPTPGSLHG
ncbi:hypothetical protein [Streptomyces sp. NPDC002587]